ncbi:hypothetical protein PVA17_21570 [Lysinibacillus sp. CNPSo 3705]|uniref:hypothetical protein n=1 Tax=Lysinibacillus sp. CNPSo 3705 TaxID=3028148 RepID=UPI002364851D|nr:hypothetical protein [Lysinibacillus sp. CNPSo 3705]MDD1505313.1 hypothetical protein [Lysinibacillus sp. CNPSo 3705]
MNHYKSQYIGLFPEDLQRNIIAALQAKNLDDESIEDAMNSRLCDLENTIDLTSLLDDHEQ